MTTSDAGIGLIKQFEGVRLTAYRDSVGVPTIGYGSTRGVKMGDVITQAEADTRLRQDLQSAEFAVNRLVKPALTQNQFDALVSFVFNLGGTALASSTLLKYLNNGKYAEAAQEFPKWTHAGGAVLAGLIARRAAERALFLQP